MLKLTDGQCGLCEHFGEHAEDDQLVQIRVQGEAPEDLKEPCGHPDLAPLKLEVTAISGCAGFTPIKKAG
ncbi:MAG: hypothetical protein AAGI30_01060 [Planctomycetota bacterium]